MSEAVPGSPILPEVKMHLASPVAPCVGTVVETHRCTASSKAAGFVRHVSIDITGTPLAGNFRAGQAFGVLAPGVDQFGKPHKLRLYSIASPSQGEDGKGNILATTVKRTIDEHNETHKLFLGVCSNYLCDLQVGDKVTISGPNGKRFLLPAQPQLHDYLFVATGTGIAPFRGMIMELLSQNTPSRITLIMGSPYSSDLLYHQQFEALAAQHPNFTYLPAISRERGSGGGAGKAMYAHDRVLAERDRLAAQLASERCLIYVCGIAGMELGIFQSLAAMLTPEQLAQYLTVKPEAGEPKAWDRKMISKTLVPTKRVMLEVY
jgi:ferredoxin--NADP+ reductase